MPASTYETGVSQIAEAEDLETLKKQLPHVDLETGLKHRVVKRDPISGLGTISIAADIRRPRTASAGRQSYNKTLIAWNADDANSELTVPSRNHKTPIRNPINLTGDLGTEVDLLRTTSQPRHLGTSREPQRDPIAGRGCFGTREWDPIGKYNGRTRRAKSSNDLRRNPLTGDNIQTFLVNIEEKNSKGSKRNKNSGSQRNIFTGENCNDYGISPEIKSYPKRPEESSKRNIITGENCTAYDFNSEVRRSRKQTPVKASDPVSGINVTTFMVSKEERPRTSKPYVYKNTVTGENISSYKITPIERNVTPRVLKDRQNPLNGENLQTYKYRIGEGKLNVKKRDISSPLTGDGARGGYYTVSIEERAAPQPQPMAVNGRRIRARSYGPTRNVLTGENCESFGVCKEMRSERSAGQPMINGKRECYNIITGVTG